MGSSDGAPAGPMAGRFNRARLQYIWQISKRGPTEIGYAYFRARRRRKNRADDEPLLSESDQLALSGAFDLNDAALADNERTIRLYRQGPPAEIRSILWYLPFFHHVYFGGTFTLLRFADHFAREHGVQTRFHCYDVGAGPVGPMARKVAEAFPALAHAEFTSANDPAPGPVDAAIASLWTSVYPLVHNRQTRSKFYFVQDNEQQFYAAGAASAMVEQTYRLGLPGIVNTPGLADVYRGYGNPAVSFVPAVDRHRYHPPESPRPADARVRVFFYARPKTPRNAFGLGIAALAQLKERFGDRVDIVCAGENWNPAQFGLSGRVRNLGVLATLDEVAALYRSCDIGLVFMLSKHPSYQPFEFMASGMATVSNINPATQWLLRDEENCLLTPPLPTPTADRLGRLVNDTALRRRIAAAGREAVLRYRWEEQIEGVWNAITLRSDELRSTEGFKTSGGTRRQPAASLTPRGLDSA